MNDFLKFFNEKKNDFPMHLEIYYSKIMDWCISITKKRLRIKLPRGKSQWG